MNEDIHHPIVSIGKVDIDMSKNAPEPDPADLPLLLTRDLVLFPGVVFPIQLGREASVKVATVSHEKGIPIGVVCQRDPQADSPSVPSDIYNYGVTAMVLNIFDLPDGTKTAIVQAMKKFRITGCGAGNVIPGVPAAQVKIVRDTRPRVSDKEFLALTQIIKDTTLKIVRQNSDGPSDLSVNLDNVENPMMIVNLVATYTPFPAATKIEMLKVPRLKERAFLLLGELTRSEQMADIMENIKARTRQRISEQQRNAFLQQQMEALREESYGEDDDDIRKMKQKADDAGFPEDVRRTFDRELEKLSRLNPQSPDYSVQYSYLDTLTDLPWNKPSVLSTDFVKAEEILESEHYGLEKVKERILEQLAVMMHNPSGRSPIICLVGAPGVGKTSLGKSVAAALGRKYCRVSLGGMHDEAEIRGHRRTYIGAMPGRIIDAVRRAGSSNPLLLLDEIDKLGKDFRGDPSSALLEVLDPEQNSHFHDNYVDVDFDLSNVLFIATANTLSTVPQPLIDRMEIIEMPGYLIEEKEEIARRHLIRRALADNAVEQGSVEFTREALVKIVDNYTSESGVRQLEKEIASMIRKLILRKMRGNDIPAEITPELVRQLLGVERFTRERYDVAGIPGVATGLAWTAVGGEILFIESSLAQAKGDKLTLTGNLGDVMKESAMIALHYVKSHAPEFGIDPEIFEKQSLHIHVPEGAIPKDGPSAGITMATSIVSAFTRRPLKAGIAMTGELTLRGKVLPVGGIKEKILAAKRAGIDEIILSVDNRKDIADIKPEYIKGMTFHYVSTVSDVINIALA